MVFVSQFLDYGIFLFANLRKVRIQGFIFNDLGLVLLDMKFLRLKEFLIREILVSRGANTLMWRSRQIDSLLNGPVQMLKIDEQAELW